MRPLVVIGLLGVQLDAGGARRWDRWRPTVDLCRHEDLLVQRLELLVQPNFGKLAQLVVDDIARVSPETQVRCHDVAFDDAWDFEQVYAALHDFALSYPFMPEREEYLLHITTGSHVAQICEFLLAESQHIPARLLQTSPPRGARGSPGSYSIIDLDLSRYDRLASRFASQQLQGLDFLKSGIATRSSSFNRMIELVERVASNSSAPLLFTGPTGAGKSQLAARVYELKKQRRQVKGRFVEVNCATLRGDGAMSALFGHTRGAFTGAASARDGLLREADGGLLFLDEIGELGLDEQAMLLRAIEEGRFMPVGADREVQSEFQLISGTNRDLRAAVREGRFRRDLLARIDLWSFELPSLRERLEDLEPNLDYELERLRGRRGQRVTFSREARVAFLQFACSADATWEGNFRDFAASVERMATLAPGGRITEQAVADEVERLRQRWCRTPEHSPSGTELEELLGSAGVDQLDRFDRVQLCDVLRVCRQSRSLAEAGRELFAQSRLRKSSSNDADRLRKYLARFGISWDQLR